MAETTDKPEPPMPERVFPERTELLAYDCWYHDDENLTQSVLYLDVNGKSPIITNHLSDLHIQVIDGSGRLATGALIHKLERGEEQYVKAKVPYRYIGKMSLLVTARPILISSFVTFNNEPLGREEQQIMKRYHKMKDREERTAALLHKLEILTERFVSFTQPSNVTWR